MPLGSDDIEKLRALLASSGWRDVIYPSLVNRSKQIIQAFRTTPSKRTGEWQGLEDRDLRSKLDEIEWFLIAFRNEVTVFDQNKRLDELEGDTANP